jgi:dienelactone hydrolase
MSPLVLGFADRVVALGCTAVLPNLFGTAGRDPFGGNMLSTMAYGLRSMGGACISREFTVLATGRSSPVITWLRALARAEHARCAGPGVGVVGMCFTGGFALAMAVDENVLAPVLSQPSLPFSVGGNRKRSIDTSDEDIDKVATRCAAEGLRVLGLRFKGDPFVPGERFDFLRERLGDGFVAVELEQADGNPDEPVPRHHSVLTGGLIDEPGQPTRAALDKVLDLFRTKLLAT